MLSRYAWIPVGLFLIWGFISHRWYVCHIQQACQTSIQTVQSDESSAALPDAHPAASQVVAASAVQQPEIPATVDEPVPDLRFLAGRSQLMLDSKVDAYMGRLAAQLASSGDTLRITGHTDSSGTPKGNVAIGLRRAASVRDLLIQKGVPAQQLQVYSEGQSKPKASNESEDGRRQNRRVELLVVRK